MGRGDDAPDQRHDKKDDEGYQEAVCRRADLIAYIAVIGLFKYASDSFIVWVKRYCFSSSVQRYFCDISILSHSYDTWCENSKNTYKISLFCHNGMDVLVGEWGFIHISPD